MKEVNTSVIEVPESFRLACELFGITVPDFIQLFVNHYSFVDNFFYDNSPYDLATKSFPYVMEGKGKGVQHDNPKLEKAQIGHLQKLMQRIIKVSINRSYSYGQRRNRGRVLTNSMFDILSKNKNVKTVIYMDEETKINLNKDILVNSIFSGVSVAEFLNRVMRCVTLPDHLARMHLDKGVYNPVIALYIRVYDGYGDIVDEEYRSTAWAKEFIMDIQELDKRFFFNRKIEHRIAAYEDWLDDYLLNNKY